MTTTCPTCGHASEAALSSNTGATRMMEVPAHLFPALADALGIGVTTAMLCDEPQVKRGLAALEDIAKAWIPEPARAFEPAQWAPLVLRAEAGVPLRIEVIQRGISGGFELAVHDERGLGWPGQRQKDAPLTSGFLKRIKERDEADRLADLLKEYLDRLAPIDGPGITVVKPARERWMEP